MFIPIACLKKFKLACSDVTYLRSYSARQFQRYCMNVGFEIACSERPVSKDTRCFHPYCVIIRIETHFSWCVLWKKSHTWFLVTLSLAHRDATYLNYTVRLFHPYCIFIRIKTRLSRCTHLRSYTARQYHPYFLSVIIETRLSWCKLSKNLHVYC